MSYREILQSKIGEKTLETENEGEMWVTHRESSVKELREDTRNTG